MSYDKYYIKNRLSRGSQSCDVILTIGRQEWWDLLGKFVSGKIQEATKGPFCHLAVQVKDGNIIEAVSDGIKCNPLRKYVNDKEGLLIFHNDKLTEKQKKAILRFLYLCVDLKVKYDFWGVLRFVAPWIAQEKGAYFCSENGKKGFDIAQEDFPTKGVNVKISNKSPQDTSPNDVFRYLISEEAFKNGWLMCDDQNIKVKELLDDFKA